MGDGPFLLVDCEEVDAPPDPDGAGEVAGDHPVAGRVEPDHHDGVGVGLPLLLGGLGVLVPDGDATWVDGRVPLSQPMARMGLKGCHSMQVGVMDLDSSYWCLSPLSLKRWILLEVVMAIVGLMGTLETAILMILSWLFFRSLI